MLLLDLSADTCQGALGSMGKLRLLTSPSILVFFVFIWFPSKTFSYQKYQQLNLPVGVVGPESLAFDCKGKGPYTGVSDGRILKWHAGARRGWRDFAVTTPSRKKSVCDGTNDFNLQHLCGRPLGLQFNYATCELYIADAYFGLMKVGKSGGVAAQLASSAEGLPLQFTNSLDIDQENRVVYFTDSSLDVRKRGYNYTSDKTGRFMRYDERSRKVTLLLKDLKFANGVALSKDKRYVLVSENTANRVLKYWLRGPKAGKTEVFIQLSHGVDNIKRNAKGQFWVGLYNDTAVPTIGLKLDRAGKIVKTLEGDGSMITVSEVNENNGTLFVGSSTMTFVSRLRIRSQG